ncbi:MAG: hypothetical protein EOO11_04540 [Chitinophagaceae bacterium]|nr:MAG: hypothetical protein EOO11_04540 [Chitinophagaceae bacterium]
MKPITGSLCLLLVLLFSAASAQDSTAVAAFDSARASGDHGRDATPQRPYPLFRKYPQPVAGTRPLAAFIPRGWTLQQSTEGDLNGDGLRDLALVLQYRDTVLERWPGGFEWEGRPRVLRLLFRSGAGYRMAFQHNYILGRAGTGKQGGDPLGKLAVARGELELRGPMGGAYYFRYINDDFYLVRAWTNGTRGGNASVDPATSDTFYYVHIDYCSGRVRTELNALDGEERPRSKSSRSIGRRPLLRLRDLFEFDERRLFRGLAR